MSGRLTRCELRPGISSLCEGLPRKAVKCARALRLRRAHRTAGGLDPQALDRRPTHLQALWQAPERFDILIRNGHVYDGNGNPWILADVGIIGDRIRAVGRLAGRGPRARSTRRVWR